MRKPKVHERYVLVEVTPPSVKSMPLGLFNGPLAQCLKVYPIAPCQLIYIFIIKYFADYHVALYWRSSNFRLEKSSLNLKSEQTLNAPCTLCETLLARSEILYFLVFSQTELAPSPNKSCQYKVSATQYLPISSVVGTTGYTIYCSFSYCPLMGTCTPKASLDLYWASKHPFFSLPENYVAS